MRCRAAFGSGWRCSSTWHRCWCWGWWFGRVVPCCPVLAPPLCGLAMARDSVYFPGCILLLCLARLHRPRRGGCGSRRRRSETVVRARRRSRDAVPSLRRDVDSHAPWDAHQPCNGGQQSAVSPVTSFRTSGASLGVIPQKMLYGVDSFPLLAVPLFMLAGELMSAGGITTRIVRFAAALVGWITGGLAHVVIVVNMIMAGMSGSAVADAAATRSVLIPAMVKAVSASVCAAVPRQRLPSARSSPLAFLSC